MALKFVTCTGADDATALDDLLELAIRYPQIEWALLFSHTRAGQPRYPSAKWIHAFLDATNGTPIKTSIHLCGVSVVDFIKGSSWADVLTSRFDRVQLNWDQAKTPMDPVAVTEQIARRGRPVITQMNDANAEVCAAIEDTHHHVLFDASGGRGISLTSIPAPMGGKAMSGYAGGLNPSNIPTFAPSLARVAEAGDIWIDLETGLRNADDRFDLGKVSRFMTRLNAAMEFRTG